MIRPYRQEDADALWELKQGFELGLAEGTGDDAKATRYADKLDDQYRHSYLDWVDRCRTDESRAIQVAERRDSVVGYVFVLPDTMAHIWDGAVLNELYVAPAIRGTGVGVELLEAAVRTARAQDLPLDRILLDVDRANDRARTFYDHHGFEHWGEMLARDLSAPEDI
ncbi:GNAT family N-acetyltransferase [Halodesulfurarchaeum sp.]|uniref:GNAT family N-acetyltransferase n=1 Tax=Halodesulfurarchaeum sp. TaxID=1980530 RepID=UPI002FC2947D